MIMMMALFNNYRFMLILLNELLLIGNYILHVLVYKHLLIVVDLFFTLYLCFFRCITISCLFRNLLVIVAYCLYLILINLLLSFFWYNFYFKFIKVLKKRYNDEHLKKHDSYNLQKVLSLFKVIPSQNIESLLYHNIHRIIIELKVQ